MFPETTSDGAILVEFTGRQEPPVPPSHDTPGSVLAFMIHHHRHYGTPLPDGYVPPPGIDIEALLKQLPPYPPAPRSAG